MSGPILALVAITGGAPERASLEALALARRLASDTGAALEAVLIADEAAARSAAASLAGCGVTTAVVVTHDQLTADHPDGWAAAVAQVVEARAPAAVVGAGTERGNELLARVAARLGLPMAAPAIESAAVTLSDRDLALHVTSREAPERGRISLADARVVIGGGRGVGSGEGFADLEELAGLLGGAVGGSRVVTSAGWRPHADQIGQTGLRIAPDIYIACGISGAIQHIVGCKAAKHILAINTDAEAPIMGVADYAVIGDLHTVVPAISAEIRRRGAAT